MLRRELERRAARSAEHHRTPELTPRHVAELGGAVHDFVDRQQREVPGHHLDDRAKAYQRGSHPDPGKAQLRDRGVDHPLGTEFLEQAPAYLVRPVVFGDFLSHEEDPVVPLHLLAERVVQRIAISDDSHIR